MEEKNEKVVRVGVLNKFSLDLVMLVDKTYLIKGIHVTSDFTEVTNGHYALRITNVKIWADDYPVGPGDEKIEVYTEPIDIVIPENVARRMQKNLPVRMNMPILQSAVPGQNTKKDGTNVEFITYDLEIWSPINFRPDDLTYPDLDKVLPTEHPELVLGFDPDYMIKLCQQFKKNGVETVKLSLYGENKVMQLEGKNMETSQELKALLMPKKV